MELGILVHRMVDPHQEAFGLEVCDVRLQVEPRVLLAARLGNNIIHAGAFLQRLIIHVARGQPPVVPVASKARRRARMRSAGVSGVERIKRPTSVALANTRSACTSSGVRPSSTEVGISGSSGCRVRPYCTRMLTLLSRSCRAARDFTPSQVVECPSTSPR